jgi:hypothetical protein
VSNVEATVEAFLLGELYNSSIEKLKVQVPTLDNSKLNIILSFHSKISVEGKQKIDALIQ